MKIIHVIYNDWTSEQVEVLSTYGIKVEPGSDRFDIEEGELYFSLKPHLTKWKVEESFGSVYNSNDIKESKLLVYVSTWVNDYPQPEDVPGYLKLTYDLQNYCNICGVGAKQKAPFRLKREPKWGHKKMFELNWVFDELFVHKEIYESVFAPLNIESIPVLFYKKDIEIENIVQLKIPFINKKCTLSLDRQPFQLCKTCGQVKYNPKIKGYFPGFTQSPGSMQIFKCNEFFGSELEAHNKIFITADLLRKLNSKNIKPNVWPVR